MNNREAKEILLLYRPGTADRDDPEIAAALEVAQHEPELARWFEEHCQIQEALRAKFAQIAVPEGLKEQILSERKMRVGHFSGRKTVLVAAAATAVAAIVIVAAMFYFQPAEDMSFSGFQHRMVATVREYPRMDLETNDLGQIRSFLAAKGRGNFELPSALAKAAGTGCKVLTWQDKPVAMICFNSGTTKDPSEPDLFLFVIAHGDVPGAPGASSPRFGQTSRLNTASWTAGDKTYLLGTFGEKELLTRYL